VLLAAVDVDPLEEVTDLRNLAELEERAAPPRLARVAEACPASSSSPASDRLRSWRSPFAAGGIVEIDVRLDPDRLRTLDLSAVAGSPTT
jgi:hypothetical protein